MSSPGSAAADIDTSQWSILVPCVCHECRQQRIQELLRSNMRHPWELTIWIPPLPFNWPTTQKAICS